MKQYLLLIPSIFATITYAQNTTINGSVIDANTGESLIGASVVYGKGMGVAADYDGNFVFSVPSGDRKITVSYVGYQQESKSIKAEGKSVTVKFKLKPIQLSEIHIVGDVAKDRETPVAFTNVSLKKVNEELASQDIPMILNSTPGVYATQSGGGDGDARITIRGFNQRNVAVMIDGIPVNDMENGWVYWSNWSGLDAVTSNIQVQRGLGASKIAIPSVGGTMNILTRGIGNEKSGTIKQDIGSFGRLKTSIGYNSGKMDNGWGFTLAGSYKRGNGFVQETWTEGYFYYAKIQKEIGNHTFTLSAMGAPQKHGQRSYKSTIYEYDTTYANSLGIGDSIDYSTVSLLNRGVNYNKHWGNLDRWSLNSNGDTIHNNSILNTKQNYFHKPQYSLRHFWVVNDKFYISNISYASIGNGGGTGVSGNTNNYDMYGQYNLQDAYNGNIGNTDLIYSDTEYKSSTYLRSSINNHYWYGLLSTANYNPSEEISISGGLDLRTYKGEHYREVYDLLGGDYAIDESNGLQLTQRKRVGDIVGYHNDGFVKWLGGFG
ncbi:MAG: TonB-dependent receptor plug domain-containing protein, partial [Flavobacteriales bacterium]|nr:TonB-dependent receptor plug domain-containing protein [Flavobacteriales bacterium]